MTIFWTQKAKLANEQAFHEFIQKMANRLIQGFHRYGNPKATNKHLTRLKLELKSYERTGNAEHLVNLANYAHLEWFAPEHKKFHFDSSVESVTRGRI